MCFYAYKNVLEPMGHLGANLIFSILTLNQVSSSMTTARPTHHPSTMRCVPDIITPPPAPEEDGESGESTNDMETALRAALRAAQLVRRSESRPSY